MFIKQETFFSFARTKTLNVLYEEFQMLYISKPSNISIHNCYDF